MAHPGSLTSAGHAGSSVRRVNSEDEPVRHGVLRQPQGYDHLHATLKASSIGTEAPPLPMAQFMPGWHALPRPKVRTEVQDFNHLKPRAQITEDFDSGWGSPGCVLSCNGGRRVAGCRPGGKTLTRLSCHPRPSREASGGAALQDSGRGACGSIAIWRRWERRSKLARSGRSV
jgi:hypothetical protein